MKAISQCRAGGKGDTIRCKKEYYLCRIDVQAEERSFVGPADYNWTFGPI